MNKSIEELKEAIKVFKKLTRDSDGISNPLVKGTHQFFVISNCLMNSNKILANSWLEMHDTFIKIKNHLVERTNQIYFDLQEFADRYENNELQAQEAANEASEKAQEVLEALGINI